MKWILTSALLLLPLIISAKEVALSFDDAPNGNSPHFEGQERTEKLIKKLQALNIPPVMIFANACKREDSAGVIAQLAKYRQAGHFLANHTCSHPRLDDVGFEEYAQDAAKGDKLLQPLFVGQKFFRFPFLNEGKEQKLRDQMREWLRDNHYRNGMVSIDNDDYLFSAQINEAKAKNKKINYKKVEKLFLEHVLGAANFYDKLALKTLGRSPKHVILLHEVDATVMFLEPLVKTLRKEGWKIISVAEAYQDQMYLEQPKNTYANNGIISQIYLEKTGVKDGYYDYDRAKKKLDRLLGLAGRR